jgi:hypothetical protein
MAFGLAAVPILALGLGVRAVLIANEPPTFTCATPDTKACTDTEQSILSYPELVFAQPLPARLLSVEVRPSPPEWTTLPGYGEGDWAALFTMEGREPMLMACYYSSDDMVGCDLH